MTRTIHRNFEQVTDAESARSALLARSRKRRIRNDELSRV